MFVCGDCLKKYYNNKTTHVSFAPQSYGLCECCKKTTTCYDIHHKFLQPKPEPKPKPAWSVS